MEYAERIQALVRSQSARVNTNYPFAIVCVNITLMLSDVLKLRDQMFLSTQVRLLRNLAIFAQKSPTQATYWALFEDPVAFQELFCVCLFFTGTFARNACEGYTNVYRATDTLWHVRGATRTEFGAIISEVGRAQYSYWHKLVIIHLAYSSH
jgi:hypothetical protein